MRVTMLVDITGRNGETGQPWPKAGQSVDLPAGQAEKLIRRKMAQEAKVETATAAPQKVETSRSSITTETATAPEAPVKRGRGRPRKNAG